MRQANYSALGLLLLLVSAVAADDSIPWTTDYRAAAEQAARERKLILLHFWSDDCPPCRMLDAKVFPRPEVAKAITDGYVPVKVHVARSPAMARRYQVFSWPTDVIVTPAGLEVYRTGSPQDPAKYVAMLNQTAQTSGAALAQSAKSAAQKTPEVIATQYRSNPAAENASEFQPPQVEQGTPVPSRARPAPAAQPQQNPYAARPQTSPYSPATNPAAPPAKSARAAETSRYTSEWNPEGTSPPASPDMPMYDSAPPVRAQENAYVAQPRENLVPSRAVPTPGVEASMPVVRSAPAAPTLGMEGYCVVTLAEKGAWTKGDKRFGAIHRGRLYLFGNPEAQKTFLTDPDRFAPALSGYDPVRFMESGELVDGKRAHGLAYNNQVYLFADEAALEKFQAAPRPVAETIYQAMLKSDSASKYR